MNKLYKIFVEPKIIYKKFDELNDYVILISIYKPPDVFFQTIRKLLLSRDIDVLIIDSSPSDIFEKKYVLLFYQKIILMQNYFIIEFRISDNHIV